MQRFVHAIISGRRRGIVADICRTVLAALSGPYLLAVWLRNLWYATWPKAVTRVARPVVSVGNLTTGGTGKTPLAIHLARQLDTRGLRVALLTRGYKGRTVDPGDKAPADGASLRRIEADEAALLARLCPRAAVHVNPDRVTAAGRAIERGAEVLVLDDGFQHRRLARDLDIVLVDATCPFGYGHLLPRGLLREPVRSLRRADVIVLSRMDAVSPSERERIRAAIRREAGDRPLLEASHVSAGLVDLKGRPVDNVDVSAMQAVIFAGIGRFESFRRTVEQLGASVVAAYEYPDHHDYVAEELTQLVEIAGRLEANVLLTTEKDAVKLVGRWPEGSPPLLAVRIDVEFSESDAQALGAALDAVLSADRRPAGKRSHEAASPTAH